MKKHDICIFPEKKDCVEIIFEKRRLNKQIVYKKIQKNNMKML